MKGKHLLGVLLVAFLLLPTGALADVVVPGQKPPRNEQSEAFVALYADGMTQWDSTYDHALDDVERIVLWTYPGSGEMEGTVERWFDNTQPAEALNPCYVDGEGRFWGYISYIYGHRMAWICLSDPANDNVPISAEAVAAVEREVSAMRVRERIPAILLVVGVVAVTGGLLYVFWYRKKKQK